MSQVVSQELTQKLDQLIAVFVQDLTEAMLGQMRETFFKPSPTPSRSFVERQSKLRNFGILPVAPRKSRARLTTASATTRPPSNASMSVPTKSEESNALLQPDLERRLRSWWFGMQPENRPAYVQAPMLVKNIFQGEDQANVGFILRRLGFEHIRVRIDGLRMRVFVPRNEALKA